jgi:hypothetical protein
MNFPSIDASFSIQEKNPPSFQDFANLASKPPRYFYRFLLLEEKDDISQRDEFKIIKKQEG